MKMEGKNKLTDTELLDAIVEHRLIVDRSDEGRVVVWASGSGGIDVTNEKGNVRKAIKKWLRKNVTTKPVENNVAYCAQINLTQEDGITHTRVCNTLDELKKYVESL